MTNRLGIERLCVFGMPPLPFIELAAELGCGQLGIGLAAMRYYNPHNYPDWSLKDDPALRRDTRAALRHHGVSLSLVEGFGVSKTGSVRDQAAALDVVAELGGVRINAASTDRDMQRSCDEFALLAELAAARGIETVIEIGVGPMANLAAALTAVRHVNLPDFKLLVDTMHFCRLGGTAAELAAIDPALIGYVQLCDSPLQPAFPTYMEEALHERLVPGSGQLPLADLLALVPAEVVVSVEVPQRSLAAAGVAPRERVAPCVNAARQLLAQVAGRATVSPSPR